MIFDVFAGLTIISYKKRQGVFKFQTKNSEKSGKKMMNLERTEQLNAPHPATRFLTFLLTQISRIHEYGDGKPLLMNKFAIHIHK